LVPQVRRRERYFREPRPVRFPKPLTLRMFDEVYTAPRSGFVGALDYYRRASSLPFIPRIGVPTLILTARDDPFIAVEPFETLAGLPNVEVRIMDRGGHLGFLGWDGAGGIRWAERRIVEWVMRLLKR
jgi:predicted alpha/beta-fold hydrolase